MTEEQVFLAALDLPDAAARAAYLDAHCGDDAGLRQQVEALLASHFQSGEFMDVPAPEQIGVETNPSHAVTIQSDVMSAKKDPDDETDSLEFLAPPTRPDSLGRIDHYEVLQVLGKGGFGIVFRAFDDVLQRVVAIKVMAPQMAATSPARKRFLREARTSAQVRHENVVQVYEVGEQPLPYLVMEFIPGETLQQRIDRMGPLDVLETLRIGRQIAEGLAAAHAMDLIHRDIKPGNVLLEGGQHKVKITDFGLARAADDASMTQSGQIAGTPMYMAPEQALGETLDQRADLFSLGSVLYQMVAGRAPFRANTAVAVLKRVAEDTPRNIREVIPETPQWLCDIIAKLHAKNPADRYQSAREVADVLADCEAQLKQNSRLRDFSRIPREKSAPRRSVRRPWAVAAGVLLLVLAAFWFGRTTMLYLSNRGELRLLPEDGLVSVIVLQNDEGDLTTDKLHTPMSDWLDMVGKSQNLKLPPGRYQLNVSTWPSGTRLSQWSISTTGPFGSDQATVPVINSSAIVTVERGHRVTLRAVISKPVVVPTPVAVVQKTVAPETGNGWVQLFNGMDLNGWKTHSLSGGDWRVEGGAIDGRGSTSYLFTESGDYANFHLRVEAKINGNGDAGIYIRTPFDVQALLNSGPAKFALLGGYEAAIALRASYPNHTGSLTAADGSTLNAGPLLPHQPDEWFVLEVIAEDNHIRTLVDGKPAVDYSDEQRRFSRGHIALQTWGPGITHVQFRKVEIKPLPSAGPLPPTYTNGLGMEFVIVPKGKSWLGGGKDKLGDQEVEIPADFYLGKYEVTQEEWEQVMGENPSHFSRTGEGKDAVKDIPDTDLKRFPVEGVTWDQCQVLVAKLNQRENETGWVYRLPTEAEWEYACRGGPMTDKLDSAFDFYFAKLTITLLPEQANFNKGPFRTCKVGSYQANRLGLFDMHGNVWVWCQDESPGDAIDPMAASRRVIRGGSWNSASGYCRAAHRNTSPPSTRYNYLGLRLARVPSGAPSPAAKTPPLAASPFTDADVQRIAALPAEQQVAAVVASLKERNPGLNGTASHKIVDGVVTELNFNPTDDQNALTDVSPVRALAGLTSLNLWNCSALADLRPLQGLPLTRLLIGSLSVSNQVRDLKPLQGMRLTELQLYQCQVEDLKPLAGMPLNRLRVQSRQVRDCEPLKGMPLTTLDLSNCTQIQDFTPLTGLPLTVLHLNACQIRDLQPLLGLKLTEVSLAGTRVQDLEQLKGMPLKNLAIHRTSVTDLTPLQGMDLKEIFLTPKNITQGLNHLRVMQSLNTIGIGYTSTEKWPAAEFWDRYDKEEFALAPFTESDAQRIAALPAAEQVAEVRKELMRLNPKFDGKVTPTIENEVVTELSINTDEVVNIAPVRALTRLVYLDCRGTYPNKGKLSDLSPLKGMTISRLDCSSTQVADLSPLAELPLTFLAFNHNPVSDLTPLKAMPLNSLAIAETKVSDLTPLKGKKIKTLGAQLLPVTDLSPLAGMPLTGLDLYHTIGVTSLEPLKGMPLEDLNLQDVPVSDLAPLQGMESLRTLLLMGNAVSDLSPLQGLKLTSLILRDKQISDLSPLQGMPLIRLEIYGTGVSDLTPLKGMPLQEFRLTPQNITQGLDLLRDMQSLKTIGIDYNQAWPAAEFWERLEKGEFK